MQRATLPTNSPLEAGISKNGSKQQRDAITRTGSPAEQVLVHAQAGREIVQEFVPLAESLEWNLGQEYLRQRGNKAFLSDAAPEQMEKGTRLFS